MTTQEELRQIIVANSKTEVCPNCGGKWIIPKYERRTPKKYLSRKCPYCNPLGLTIRGKTK